MTGNVRVVLLATTVVFAGILASKSAQGVDDAAGISIRTSPFCPDFLSIAFTPVSGRAPLAVAVTGYVADAISYVIDFGDGYRVHVGLPEEQHFHTVSLDTTHIYDCPGVYQMRYGGFSARGECWFVGPTIEVTEPTFALQTLGSDRTIRLACSDDIEVDQISRAVVEWGDSTGPQEFTWLSSGAQLVTPSHEFLRDGEYRINVTNYYDGERCSFEQEAGIVVSIGEQGVSITVATDPTGRQITIDGSTYTAPQTFAWTVGSTHTLAVSSPQAGDPGIRDVYSNWSDGGSQSHRIVIPSTDWSYTATFSLQYFLMMIPGTEGTVSPPSGWRDAGQQVEITATSNSGFAFDSWSGTGSGSYTGPNNPATIVMNAPISEGAQFRTHPTSAITIATNPGGREITVDGTTYKTPRTFVWNVGSAHTLAAPSPQAGQPGVQYVYSRWSDGGSQNHTLVTPSNPGRYTAIFSTQYYLTMTAGTGGTVSPPSGWQDVGEQLNIIATPDSGYTFGGWTGTGTGSYTGPNNPATIAMNAPISESARFPRIPTSAITITTNPSRREITLDGTTYEAPQTFTWAVGSAHTLGVSSPQARTAGVRHMYSNWSDGGSQNHSIITPSRDRTYTATFSTQYYLTITAGTGGTVSPPSGWREAGERIEIRATAESAYFFRGWIGSGNGSFSGEGNPATVSMHGPISEAVEFDGVPAVYALYQNYPNPFNPETTIDFDLPERGYVTLRVYNISGQVIRSPLDRVLMEAGKRSWTWDGSTGNGSSVPSGVYFYRIQAGAFSETRRAVLLR